MIAFATWMFIVAGGARASEQDVSSQELLKIFQEDQADRSGKYESIDWKKVSARDLQRRIRVATIFAEGNLNTASDYGSAAMVFQHGTTSGHYYQAFIWANEAVKLGDESQRWLTAAALDRYLVAIGHRQLFGTQFSKDSEGEWCIQPVEKSFPESLRIEYVKMNLQDEIANVLKELGSSQSPGEVKECEPLLKGSPKGTVPGFW